MLVMVVTVFILCWTPILIFEVLQAYDIIDIQMFGSIKHTKTIFNLLAYFNRLKIVNCVHCTHQLFQLHQPSDLWLHVQELQEELL